MKLMPLGGTEISAPIIPKFKGWDYFVTENPLQGSHTYVPVMGQQTKTDFVIYC